MGYNVVHPVTAPSALSSALSLPVTISSSPSLCAKYSSALTPPPRVCFYPNCQSQSLAAVATGNDPDLGSSITMLSQRRHLLS